VEDEHEPREGDDEPVVRGSERVDVLTERVDARTTARSATSAAERTGTNARPSVFDIVPSGSPAAFQWVTSGSDSSGAARRLATPERTTNAPASVSRCVVFISGTTTPQRINERGRATERGRRAVRRDRRLRRRVGSLELRRWETPSVSSESGPDSDGNVELEHLGVSGVWSVRQPIRERLSVSVLSRDRLRAP